jgi:hypothetical protein
MMRVAQGILDEDFKFDWMRAPHTTVAVPVTATAANNARSGRGSRFHIDTKPDEAKPRPDTKPGFSAAPS